jgi:hypothetical protein
MQFDVLERQRLAQNLLAAVAGADDADAEPVVRAHHIGRRQSAGQAGSYFADEQTPGLHAHCLLRFTLCFAGHHDYIRARKRTDGATGCGAKVDLTVRCRAS